MKMPPYLRTMSTATFIHPSGGAMTPPTPWIGSAIIPATWPTVVVWISSSMSVAHLISQLGNCRPKGHR